MPPWVHRLALVSVAGLVLSAVGCTDRREAPPSPTASPSPTTPSLVGAIEGYELLLAPRTGTGSANLGRFDTRDGVRVFVSCYGAALHIELKRSSGVAMTHDEPCTSIEPRAFAVPAGEGSAEVTVQGDAKAAWVVAVVKG